MSMAREVESRSMASRSSSSTITNSPFEISQPLTISSGPTSRSWTGHQRFCLIGVLHSRWRSRKETSDARAAGFVAGARPIGMFTSPKLIDPFHVVLIARPIVGECAPFATRGHFPLRCQARAWHLPAGISSRRMSQETPLDEGDGAGSPARLRTVPALWFAALAEPRTKPAYLVERDDAWEPMTWSEAAERVSELANG